MSRASDAVAAWLKHRAARLARFLGLPRRLTAAEKARLAELDREWEARERQSRAAATQPTSKVL